MFEGIASIVDFVDLDNSRVMLLIVFRLIIVLLLKTKFENIFITHWFELRWMEKVLLIRIER